MTFAQILKEKREKSTILKTKFSLLKTNKANGLIKIENKKILKKLLKGLSTLKVNFVVVTDDKFDITSKNIVFIDDKNYIDSGFDFIVCDDCGGNLSTYFSKGIVPIIGKTNTLSPLLTEFNPMQNAGNAFLYEKEDEWQIFATIIKYMENYKFSFDNKNLVKNVFES